LTEQPAGPAIGQTANLLGALSLMIADRMADAMAGAGGRPESAAAALCALLQRWMCRLCDTGACRGAEGGCPVGNAARERYLS
jgi:hypothetical protein